MFNKFENKYIITGELVVLTALHIGSGLDDAINDAPFVRMSKQGSYYIPGSSFRGYLRTKIERYLSADNDYKFSYNSEIVTEKVVEKIFGFTKNDESLAGKIHIQDMIIITDTNKKIDDKNITMQDITTVKRDGIKISRDTGTTEKGAKFDYDVITRGNVFDFKLEIENTNDLELALILIGLNEIVSEDGDIIGGKISRGIGRSRIENLKINYIESSNIEKFKKYVFNKEMESISIEDLKNRVYSKLELLVK